jgi:tRNA G10  N-methylase Trm11
LPLLERIISTSSNKGDIVLDPFCGCGTTLVAAQNLGRKWIGIDVSRTACKLMDKRLRSIGASPHVFFGDLTETNLRKYSPPEFQNWVCEKVGGRANPRKTGDFGIDGWMLDMTPIQVKQQDNIGRPEIDKFCWAIERVKKNKGIFVAFSFGSGAYAEIGRAKNRHNIEIKAITVKELLEK